VVVFEYLLLCKSTYFLYALHNAVKICGAHAFIYTYIHISIYPFYTPNVSKKACKVNWTHCIKVSRP